MSGQLGQVISDVNDISAASRRLVGGHSGEELLARPRPGKWSVCEHVEHLTLTARAFIPALEYGVRDLRERQAFAERPFRVELKVRLLRWFLEPPVRVRIPTSAPFKPLAAGSPEDVLVRFLAAQGDLISLLERGRGLALDRARIVSPFSKHMKYNLYSASVLIVTHARRHLWLAKEVVRQLRARAH